MGDIAIHKPTKHNATKIATGTVEQQFDEYLGEFFPSAMILSYFYFKKNKPKKWSKALANLLKKTIHVFPIEQNIVGKSII